MYFCTKVIEIIKMRKDMENNMFCFQCQGNSQGFSCTLKGVCGKNATTARTMDLLLFCSTRNFCCGRSIAPTFPPR